MSPLDHFI